MACLIGYGEVGLYLVAQSRDRNSGMFVDKNPYQRWIEDYSGKEYQQAVIDGISMSLFSLEVIGIVLNSRDSST